MSRYTHADMPSLRALRETLRAMIASLNALKARETDLTMLVAMASIGEDLQGQYDAAGRALDRLEKTVPGAGRSPATAAGRSMRLRRAPSSVAKGFALSFALRAALERGSVPPPADPLFSGPSGQLLPADCPVNQSQPLEGRQIPCA